MANTKAKVKPKSKKPVEVKAPKVTKPCFKHEVVASVLETTVEVTPVVEETVIEEQKPAASARMSLAEALSQMK